MEIAQKVKVNAIASYSSRGLLYCTPAVMTLYAGAKPKKTFKVGMMWKPNRLAPNQ
jgi:hypothetical protein